MTTDYSRKYVVKNKRSKEVKIRKNVRDLKSDNNVLMDGI
jgi:hypothetical protein